MLTIVVGLPGSGKSMYTAIEAIRDRQLVCYDDCLGGIVPGAVSTVDLLIAAIRLRRTIIANDALLCLDSQRMALRRTMAPHLNPHYPARWLFFANEPEACRLNVERRHRDELARSVADARERRRIALEMIGALTPSYRIPGGAEMMPVVDYSGQRSAKASPRRK